MSWYYPQIHQGIARYAGEHGWHLSADITFGQDLPWGWKGDGVIALVGGEGQIDRFVQSVRAPVVDVVESRPEIRLPRVVTDNRAIAELAARHFLDRGFEHIALVRRWGLGVDQSRTHHFKEALASEGRTLNLLAWDQARGRRNDTLANRRRWLATTLPKLPRPLALWATRDDLAVEVIEACRDAGLMVPEEMAVLGVDNNPLVCDCALVPLSSIDARLDQVGYQAAALLDGIMSGNVDATVDEPIRVAPAGVITRQSTDILAIPHTNVARALRYIWDRYAFALKVDEIAAAANLSRSGLERAFRRYLGRSVHEEVVRVRLAHVKRRLTSSEDRIFNVALDAGFESQQALYHHFRRQEGMTPRQYRQQHRQSVSTSSAES